MGRLLVPAAALVLAAALVAGCGSEAGGPVSAGEPISFEQLASSAQASADAQSGRFAFAFALSAPDQADSFSFSLSGEGAFDVAAERASLSVDMPSFLELPSGPFPGATGQGGVPGLDGPDGWRIHVVRDGSATYVRFPAVAGELPAGKTWVREDGTGSGSVLGFGDLDELTKVDPRRLLELLRGAGEVETAGTEELRGVPTTRYRVLLDPARYAEAVSGDANGKMRSLVDDLLAGSDVGEIPIDVWLDADGLVRKVELVLSGTQTGSSEVGEASASFEIWDYGEDVEIEVPPPSQVVDASALKG
jgi:hypothetical protein